MYLQIPHRPVKSQIRGGSASSLSLVLIPQPSLPAPPAPALRGSGPRHSPVGVLLRNEDEGVMGGVTGGVRLPLLWRGGVDTFPRDTELDKVSDSFG